MTAFLENFLSGDVSLEEKKLKAELATVQTAAPSCGAQHSHDQCQAGQHQADQPQPGQCHGATPHPGKPHPGKQRDVMTLDHFAMADDEEDIEESLEESCGTPSGGCGGCGCRR